MLTCPDGIIAYLSPACQAVLGYSPEELVGKQPWIVYPEDLRKVKNAHYQALKGGNGINLDYRIITKSGRIKWIAHSWAPILKDNKLQMVVSVIRDITERKEAREKLEKLNKEILLSNKRLKQLSLRDSHTGLYNHRYLEEIIEVEFDKAKRYGSPLSIIMLDIDYFKSINDAYGHQFGDLVLSQLAGQLKRKLRRYDIVIRYGGEEFIILSPITDRPTAMVLAQRLLDSLHLYNFGNRKQKVRLKLSFAVAAYPESRVAKGMDLIEEADKILNYAKESGGNRVYSSLDMKKERVAHLAKNGREPVGVKYLREKIDKLNRRANQSLIEAIFAFAKTIELKDKYTGRHVELTVKYATDMAKKLRLSSKEIDDIRQASILHDLGKIGISEKILLKRAKLTKEEFEEIKRHPQIGVDIIRPLHFLHDIIPLILYHHERWDGNGYPHGLKGEDIPIGARIIAVADAYQALTSHRPYRKAYAKRRALQIIREDTGTHFDPNVVKVFLEILGK
jgi:diguanylate cyclase (GGDEF)-like protein/PAS domain S-box-containing protein